MTQHLKPLYIKAHMNGRPVNKVLVDNGVAINILPYKMLSKLAKIEEDVSLRYGSQWFHRGTNHNKGNNLNSNKSWE